MATLKDLEAILSQDSETKKAFESEEYAYSLQVFKKRMELGLTQTQLAKAAKVTQKTISRIEGADPGIQVETLNKVSGALGLNETKVSSPKKRLTYH